MYTICLGSIIVGVFICVVGTAKSINSKFKDLNAIIWCFVGTSITVLGAMFAAFL